MILHISVILSIFLTTCRQDVRDLRLVELDLSEVTVVEEIGRELGDEDRRAFTTYVAVHGPSGRLCGDMLSRGSKQPQTIGDAVNFMRFGKIGRNDI